MQEFRKHGLSEESAKHIKFAQALVTSVDRSESGTLIAYVSVEAKKAIHEAFVIGRLDGSEAKAELVRSHKTTDLADGKDGQGYSFVDQLDLDGDGTDEIVVEVTGYERKSSEFSNVSTALGSGCMLAARADAEMTGYELLCQTAP